MEDLAEQFEAHRPHLRAVALRMLGSPAEADDAVQESWLRLSRADTSEVTNLSGWLTTVVARVCLDLLRSRSTRREDPLDDALPEVVSGHDPEREVLIADAVGPALLVVLETLTPAERLAFVLHDLFGVSFEEIATVVERSPAAARQLASRARRRVRGGSGPSEPDAARQRQVVDAFLAASRNGNFEALLAVLDPGVVVRSDASVLKFGGDAEVRGAREVAATFSGRAKAVSPALINGLAGAAWLQNGHPVIVFDFTVESTADGDRIVAIDLIADRDLVRGMDIATR